MSGQNTGLDFEALEPFQPIRINLAVTPADSERLFAYISGKNGSYNMLYIYFYNGSIWQQLYSGTGYLSDAWMGFAVSPVNKNEYYFYGKFGVWGTTNLGTPVRISEYNTTGVYSDGHVLTFQPNIQANPLLFFGHHAGISVKASNNTWSFRNNGLQNQLIWSFDNSNFESGVAMIANQDCYVYSLEDGNWNCIFQKESDSYSVKNSKTNSDLFFHSAGDMHLMSFNKSTWTNYEESDSIPYDFQNPNEQTRIVKTFKLISFPNDTADYLGFCEIYKRNFDWPALHNINDLWEIDSDLGKIEPLSHKRQITEIDYCQSQPDTIYLATGGQYPFEGTLVPILAKTTIGGNNGNYSGITAYQHLEYPGMSNDDYPVISGIAVHPTDPDKVWISLIGYDNIDIRVAYSNDGGNTWNNADPNNSLPELPMNGIVYQYGSNDVLYLATDVGVYYKDATMDNWEEYGEFPHVRVTELKINYCENKLRAATFGRALWEADLLPSENPICYAVESGDTLIWNKPKALQTGIKVKSGGLMIIENLVNMPVNGKIIIEPGGKMIIDGGTLTNSCGKSWQGIEVWGNPTLTQIPANQGWLEIINGGTIENAEVAVRAGSADYTGKGGGIVSAEDAVFLNNTVSAMFDPYTAYTNTSAFGSCIFNYTKTISGEPELYFAKLNNVIFVQFNNCTFTNNSNQERIGVGIESINSIFSVEGVCTTYSGTECTDWDPGLFENLEYGVYATASTTTRFADIRHTTFTDNSHGIYLGGMTLPRVTSNEFQLNRTASQGGYGLYLDGSTQYWVEDNHFESSIAETPTGIGIYVNASGSLANEIYLNSFDYIEYAVTVLGYNRNSRTTTTGLQIRCNNYDHTLFDETIVHEGPFIPGSDGIASIQGSNSTNVEDMAGNIFYYNTTVTGDFDDLNNQSNHFYYYYSNNATGYSVEPLDYTVSKVTKVPKTTSTWTYEGACPSNLSTGGGGGTEGLRSSLSEAQSNIVNTETVLLALVDGGDTETLNADVETSTPPETAEIYNELMTGSPYLSETVVGTAIDKEEVLPNSMVRDVMVANPHTSTSFQLLDKLDNRTNPMPAWMKAQILAGRSIQSLKTELEGQLAGYQNAKCRAMNSLARHFGQQPENPAITDSLIALYQSDNTLSSRYMQAWLYLNSGQYQQGQNVMALIPANFTLAGDEFAEYQNMQLLYAMLKGLLESGNGLDDLSEAQIAQLHTIVADETDFASVYARNMLLAIDEFEYQEPIILPNSMKSAEVEEAYHEALNSKAPTMLEVYPNPSKDFIILAYQFDKETKGMIEIKDISGKPVQSITINGMQDQVTVTTHGWPTGVYVISLVVNDKVIETTKFTLVE